MRKSLKLVPLLALVLALALPLAAQAAVQVFFENFDGALSPNFSGVTTTVAVNGFNGLPPVGNQFGGNFLQNTTTPPVATTLTLTGLPLHTSIDLDFLLAAIDSWDSTNGSVSPDYFNVAVDGVTVFQTTFAHASGNVTYTPPPGGALSPITNLGFGHWPDSAYNMAFEPALHNIAHTSSTLTVDFFASGGGWQGGGDENWAIDNLSVSYTPIPVPPTALLLLSGLAGLGFLRRRF